MTVEIDYSELKSAANYMDKAAKKCTKYADKLKDKICDELSDLPLGSSSYTSSASYFAQSKIKQLRKQEQTFQTNSKNIEDFIEEAKDTDKRVAGIMKREGNDFRKANNLDYGWADGLVQAFTRFAVDRANRNDLSRWITAQLRNVTAGLESWYLDKKHWYACEGGKYIISAVFKAFAVVAAAIAAIAAIIVAWPLLLGAATLSSLAAAFTAIGACIALADSVVDFLKTCQAAGVAKTDPGWAARYADMNTVSEYLKKTCFDSKWGNIISNYAAISIDAVSVVCTVVSIANTVKNGYKFFTNTYRANANWKSHFNMWDKNGNFSFKRFTKHWKKNMNGFKYAFNHDFQYTQWHGARQRNYQLYDGIVKMKKGAVWKNTFKTIDILKDGIKKYEENVLYKKNRPAVGH